MSSYNNSGRSNRSDSSSRSQSGGYSGGSSSRRSYGGGGGGNRSRYGRKTPKRLDKNLFVSEPVLKTEDTAPAYVGKLYSEMPLNNLIQENLAYKKFVRTTEIKEKTFDLIGKGHDMLGISATGSGKTGAFLIPMIQKLLDNPGQKVMVIAPTRELAQQISKEATTLLRNTRMYSGLIIGGESAKNQIWQLKKGVQVLVGTPGRMNDLIKRGDLDASQYENIVVDEVDRLFDMGFIDDVKFIFSKLKSPRQTLFFSATLNKTVERVVESLSDSYDVVKLSNNTPTTQVVQSIIDYTHSQEKIDKLQEILDTEAVEKAIIFVETKRYADQVQMTLRKAGLKVEAIHGDKRQNVRKRVIEMFKRSKVNVLVATNVAARGIDIDDITHVINLDEPTSYDEYIHRIGRTGRNGSFGTAFTFVKRGM